MRKFTPLLLKSATLPQFARLAPVYQRILLGTLDAVIERFIRNGDYPFIDTKLDIFTGKDLSRVVGGVDIFGRHTVYSWIQSRGIEALCGHHAWIKTLKMPADRKRRYLKYIPVIIERVTRKMETIRRRNGGTVFFWVDKNGSPFSFDEEGLKIPARLDPSIGTASDMFHVKALAAAAVFLKDAALVREARRYFAQWVRNVKTDKVRSDQQPFDPKNPVGDVPNRRSHAARMITLGAFALYAHRFGDAAHVRDGLGFIRHILDNHVNINGRFPRLEEYDFVEFIDPRGRPYLQDGDIISDPGHALEFVGLSFKFLNVIRKRKDLTKKQRAFIARCDEWLPAILLHAFHLGYNARVGGICKTVALNRRAPGNSDMPWWNLPETMRAALFAAGAARHPQTRQECLDVVRKCSNAFLANYINPKVYLMAYQTLDAAGKPVRVIPATPDLDPGYHTGLSIIDFMEELKRQAESPGVSVR